MTTEQIEKPGGAPQVSLVEDIHTRPDDVLTVLVGVINDSKDMSLSVTLHVSGTIVCGLLISYEAYWEAFRALLRGTGSPAAQAFGDAFTSAILGAGAAPDAEEAEDEAAAASAPPRHIHLRDATVWAPGAEPTLAKTLWRGRLSQVSAWSIGAYGD